MLLNNQVYERCFFSLIKNLLSTNTKIERPLSVDSKVYYAYFSFTVESHLVVPRKTRTFTESH